MTERPVGQLFSQVYLKRGEPVEQSMRFRKRLAVIFDDLPDTSDWAKTIRRRLGVDVPEGAYEGVNWARFFEKAELRDVLDTLTIAYKLLRAAHPVASYYGEVPGKFLWEISLIFEQENLAYRLDEQGGVHFAIDAEFQATRASALKVLSPARYENSRVLFEQAHSHLDSIPPNGKAAVRDIFAAVEGLFRLMFPNAHRLAGDQVAKYLRSAATTSETDITTVNATGKLINSFKEWIESAHFYRHEPGSEEPAQPPLTLTVALVSSGSNYLRWLGEIDQKQLSGK